MVVTQTYTFDKMWDRNTQAHFTKANWVTGTWTSSYYFVPSSESIVSK